LIRFSVCALLIHDKLQKEKKTKRKQDNKTENRNNRIDVRAVEEKWCLPVLHGYSNTIHGHKYRLPANRCKMHLSRATAIGRASGGGVFKDDTRASSSHSHSISSVHDHKYTSKFSSLKVESCAPLMRQIPRHAFVFIFLSLFLFFLPFFFVFLF